MAVLRDLVSEGEVEGREGGRMIPREWLEPSGCFEGPGE